MYDEHTDFSYWDETGYREAGNDAGPDEDGNYPGDPFPARPSSAKAKPATCPKDTPWGRAQHIEELIPGQVWSVSTASHGGIYVAREALPRIPARFQAATFTRDPQWYEEDCDWAIIARFIPEAFPAVTRAKAEGYLSTYHHNLLKSL